MENLSSDVFSEKTEIILEKEFPIRYIFKINNAY